MTYLDPTQTAGASGSGNIVKIPIEMAQDIRPGAPIPITLSGTSQRVFTVAASKTSPVRMIYGQDFYDLKTSTAYTWTTGNNTILDSTGASTTIAGGAVTVGIWYLYLGMSSAGVISLSPSASAPSYVEGVFQTGYLGHPGTARTQPWQYVGFMICDAVTPTFVAATKVNKTYAFAAQAATAQVATAHTAISFTTVVPAHGVQVVGYISATGVATQDVSLTGSSVAGQGIQKITLPTTVVSTNFSSIPANSSGNIYGINTTTLAATVNVTAVEDVV